MSERLSLDPERVHVVHNGIELGELLAGAQPDPHPPVVGYLARMCPDKGLETLVEAFIRLAAGGRVPDVRLRAAGVLLSGDEAWLAGLERRLVAAGLEGRFEFRANVERGEKLELLRSISVLSVPATYGESFGLYVLEAQAAGVPVVQPRHGAFPEILGLTGGGLLCEPDDPEALSQALETLLTDPERARALGAAGRRAVSEHFSVERMARGVQDVCSRVVPA
jgi:glycosyltransferase involved in cell wall biosynthesis